MVSKDLLLVLNPQRPIKPNTKIYVVLAKISTRSVTCLFACHEEKEQNAKILNLVVRVFQNANHVQALLQLTKLLSSSNKLLSATWSGQINRKPVYKFRGEELLLINNVLIKNCKMQVVNRCFWRCCSSDKWRSG